MKLGIGAAGCLAVPFLIGCNQKTAHTLTVLNWRNYGTDEDWALEAFKARSGITVKHDYYTSETEMLAKLRAGPSRYDVIQINGAWNNIAASERLIQPIDTEELRWFSDLNPVFRDSDRLVHNGRHYGVAWVWGITSLAYNTKTLLYAPETIQVLWDGALKNRIAIRDDAIEAIGIAAIATGQDMNHPQDLKAVKDKLRALKPQLAAIWSSEDEWNRLFANNVFDVSFYWSGAAARSITNASLPVGYVVPKEGAIGWFDGLSIGTNCTNPEGALQYIDYLSDPEFYVPWATKVGAPASVNSKGNEQLPSGDPVREFHTNNTWISRLQFMAQLNEQERQNYHKLWAEVKTYLDVKSPLIK